MKKTRAEIQRAYRERKKQQDASFLQKERERRLSYYIPVEKLPRREKLRRQLKNREAVQRHRVKKALVKFFEEKEEQTVENEPVHTPQSMVVKMPFQQKSTRKRVSRALARNRKHLIKVQSELDGLKKRYRATQKRLLRSQRRQEDDHTSTPRSRTQAQLRAANINNDQARRIRRQLLMGNVVMDEVKEAKKGSKKKKTRVMTTVIAGKILKKYRCASMVSKNTGIDRRTLASTTCKNLDEVGRVKLRDVKRFTADVVSFLERDDNSRAMPGKGDKVKTAEGTVQQRVLTDYLSTLHKKYLAENPQVDISLSTFQRIRPKYIKTTAFVGRSCCLCTRHQNMALLMKTLKREGVDAPTNPERFLEREKPIEEETANIDDHEITYEAWKRVEITEKDKKKMVMRIVKIATDKKNFTDHLKKTTEDFREHVRRMKNQYDQIRKLKQSLPAHHVIVHMDFSENYSCRTADEIQSAYWHQTGVTLHPTVVYTQDAHQSYVLVSDDLNHNAAAVVTFIKQLIKDVKLIDPEVEVIHYWTDSPTSQYRNRTMFYLISNHKALFDNIGAQWNFFEAGHGKGPCDGLGGSTKRMADQATRNGKVTIQDAQDFFAWSQSPHCTMVNVNFRFIPKEDCEQTALDIASWEAKPVRGTMRVHAAIGLDRNRLLIRDVSCYCQGCLTGNAYCDGWREELTSEHRVEQPEQENVDEEDEEDEPDRQNIQVGDFVVALYEEKHYIGKVIDIDLEDVLPYNITFMEQKRRLFQWPSRKDELWCAKDDIKLLITEPQPSGKSRRLFKLAVADMQKYDEL